MAGMPRITEQTEKVFRVLLDADLAQGLWGFEAARRAGLATGTAQPILVRWERAGVLESRWADEDSRGESSGPRRRYYRFTAEGAQYARMALATLDQTRRLHAGRPGWGVPASGATEGAL